MSPNVGGHLFEQICRNIKKYEIHLRNIEEILTISKEKVRSWIGKLVFIRRSSIVLNVRDFIAGTERGYCGLRSWIGSLCSAPGIE